MTHKRFFLELLLALVGYAAAVLISGQLLAGTEPGAGRVFLALLPVPPMVALALVVIRYLRRLDEMARRIISKPSPWPSSAPPCSPSPTVSSKPPAFRNSRCSSSGP